MDVHIGTRNAPLFVSLGFSFLLSFIVLVVLNSSLSLSLYLCKRHEIELGTRPFWPAMAPQ